MCYKVPSFIAYSSWVYLVFWSILMSFEWELGIKFATLLLSKVPRALYVSDMDSNTLLISLECFLGPHGLGKFWYFAFPFSHTSYLGHLGYFGVIKFRSINIETLLWINSETLSIYSSCWFRYEGWRLELNGLSWEICILGSLRDLNSRSWFFGSS